MSWETPAGSPQEVCWVCWTGVEPARPAPKPTHAACCQRGCRASDTNLHPSPGQATPLQWGNWAARSACPRTEPPPQTALGWSHSVEGAKGGRVWWDPMGQKPPVQPGPQVALLPTCTPSRGGTICYSQGTWPRSSGQCQRPFRLLGWKNWGAESWVISTSELHQALGHPGQGAWAPGNFPGEGKADLAALSLARLVQVPASSHLP